MSKARKRGTGWETAITNYLRDNGFPHAERRALSGRADKGDINAAPGLCIEAKSQSRYSLAEWVDEAAVEGMNAAADVTCVWAHRRGKASPADGYAILTGAQLVWLLRAAGYGDPLPDEQS